MEMHIRDMISDEEAEEFAKEYLDSTFVGFYCDNYIYTEKLSFIIIYHELIHHFAELIKLLTNNEKFDIISYMNDLTSSLTYKNKTVFNTTIIKIKKLLNF
jgi:hypothetical protein